LLHGGRASGAPRGNTNALKHGFYTQIAVEQRRTIRELMTQSKGLFEDLPGTS